MGKFSIRVAKVQAREKQISVREETLVKESDANSQLLADVKIDRIVLITFVRCFTNTFADSQARG